MTLNPDDIAETIKQAHMMCSHPGDDSTDIDECASATLAISVVAIGLAERMQYINPEFDREDFLRKCSSDAWLMLYGYEALDTYHS